MSWHEFAICKPPPTLRSLQILVKSMRIKKENQTTCTGINCHPPTFIFLETFRHHSRCIMETNTQKKLSAAEVAHPRREPRRNRTLPYLYIHTDETNSSRIGTYLHTHTPTCNALDCVHASDVKWLLIHEATKHWEQNYVM